MNDFMSKLQNLKPRSLDANSQTKVREMLLAENAKGKKQFLWHLPWLASLCAAALLLLAWPSKAENQKAPPPKSGEDHVLQIAFCKYMGLNQGRGKLLLSAGNLKDEANLSAGQNYRRHEVIELTEDYLVLKQKDGDASIVLYNENRFQSNGYSRK